MVREFRPRLTYANVTATLALFLAIGGGAYAATQLPANSVGTKQLKKGAVTKKKLADGSVTGAKVADQSLTGSDVNSSTLGTVPSATNAASATNANNAGHASNSDQLGGSPPSAFFPAGNVTKIDSECGASDTPACAAKSQTALDLGVFKLSYVYAPTSNSASECTLTATATGPHVAVNWMHAETKPGSATTTETGGAGGTTTVFDVGVSSPQNIHLDGTVTYRDDNEVVTVLFESYVSFFGCEVKGTATKATS